MSKIVILGGGFGGLTVATELTRRLDDDIVVVDHRRDFVMGLRKLWALVGMGTIRQGSRPRTLLRERGIEFVEEEITGIDPERRRVTTTGRRFDADVLVVALGAEPRADMVDGFGNHMHNLYDLAAIPALVEALDDFEQGALAIVIAGGPYKCPPAPYECCMLLDDHLRGRRVRDAVSMTVTTFQRILLPNAGVAGSTWLGEQLGRRDITFHTGRQVKRIEAGRVVFADDELTADLLIGVPPHRPPAVVQQSGLVDHGDWVQVDPTSFRTPFEHVFAIGDVTGVTLANGLPLPKAGLFAERAGLHVAQLIVAERLGAPEPEPFDGVGYCFLEMGKSAATKIEGEFYARPEPRIALGDVSADTAAAKHLWEAERLERWFGG